MPIIRVKLNYRNLQFDTNPAKDQVPIRRRRNGEYFYASWLGFIDLDIARKKPYAIPVKINITAYSIEEGISPQWINVDSEREHLQGCFTNKGVYGVMINKGTPRIVRISSVSPIEPK